MVNEHFVTLLRAESLATMPKILERKWQNNKRKEYERE